VELTTDSVIFIEPKKSFKINDFEGFLKFGAPKRRNVELFARRL